MFKFEHFLWLGIVILAIAFLLWISKSKKLNVKHWIFILFISSILSETIKIFSNMVDSQTTGMYLKVECLPFHLCSIQIFFIAALQFLIKKEETKSILLCFMCPTMLLGGMMSIMIPTCGTSFASPQVYQYFLYHGVIIAFSLYLLIFKKITITFRTYFRNMGLLLTFVLFDLWVDSALQAYEANFMYLSRPPMEGLPLINLDHGWYVYFILLILLGSLVMTLFHLPFIIGEIKQKKGITKES